MLCDSRGKNMRKFIDEDIMDDIVVISEATLEVLRGKSIDNLNQLRKQSPNIKCNVYFLRFCAYFLSCFIMNII